MNVKKRFCVILSFLLAICMLPVARGAMAAEAGETVEVEFTVLEDTGAVFAATVELMYDHEALELTPNRIFDSDRKIFLYGTLLRASFRIRENAAPGEYPVTLKILEASGPMGEAVLSPETALVFSEERVKAERPPAEVPVYYIDEATGEVLKTETLLLPVGGTSTVTAEAPDGWAVNGAQNIPVTVSGDGQVMPPTVAFWLIMPTPVPTFTAAPTPVPTPTSAPAPSGKPLSGTVKAGDIITFGHYEQDNNTGNGKEPIEWLVLDVQGDRALVISRYGLDCKPYNTNYAQVTWENCSLRKWLNGEFLNEAFGLKEQAAIVPTAVYSSPYRGSYDFGTVIEWVMNNSVADTEDRIFLLSCEEACEYMDVTTENINNMKSRMSPTAYALHAGAWTNSGNETADGAAAGWWWLRSPTVNQYSAAGVFSDGSLVIDRVNHDNGCVRPALWVDLGADIF